MISKTFYRWLCKADNVYVKRTGNYLVIGCGFFILVTEDRNYWQTLPEGQWYRLNEPGWPEPCNMEFFDRLMVEPGTRDMFEITDTGAEMPVYVAFDVVNRVRVFLDSDGNNTLVSAQYFKFITDSVGEDFTLYQGEKLNDPVFFMAPDLSGPLALLMPVNTALVKYKVVEK